MDNPLISVTELDALLRSDRPPAVLDVRWALATGADETGYRAGHLPTARFVHLENDLSGTPGAGGRHPLPDEQTFTEAMRRAGVDDDSLVVCYDGGVGMSAARAWWLLRYFGHARTQVLDGGLPAWIAAGFDVTTAESAAGGGSFSIGAPLATAVEVADVPQAELLLDARDRERYLGVTEPVDPVAGHIPGAVNAPTSANVGPDGRFLSPETLRAKFEGLGVTNTLHITVYCGSGITAAHEIVALAAAGFDADLYAGSWSHWITDPARPIATGEE